MKVLDLKELLRAAAILALGVACVCPLLLADDGPPEGSTPSDEAASVLEEEIVAQLRLLAALYIENNQVEEAIECHETIVALAPEDPQRREELADVCFRHEFYGKAKPALEKLDSLKPDNPVFLHQLAICHKAAGDEKKHVELFKKALESKPDDKKAHLETAIYFEQYGLMGVLYAELQKALDIPSRNDGEDASVDVEALNKMAYYRSDEGKYKEAGRHYGRALALMEQYDVAVFDGIQRFVSLRYYCEGKQFEQEGELKKAQEKFERSVRAFEDIDAKGALYLCLKKQGKDEEAAEFFEKAERLLSDDITGEGDESSPHALNALAWFYAVTGEKIGEGLKLAQRAAESAPRSAAILDTLAELYYQSGDYKNAAKYGRVADAIPKSWNVPYFRRQHEKMKKALEESREKPADGNPCTSAFGP